MYCNVSSVCTAAGGDCRTGRSHSVFILPEYSSEATKGKSGCLSAPNISFTGSWLARVKCDAVCLLAGPAHTRSLLTGIPSAHCMLLQGSIIFSHI